MADDKVVTPSNAPAPSPNPPPAAVGAGPKAPVPTGNPTSDNKTAGQPVGEPIFAGRVGGAFAIYGEGFGSSGTVSIGGQQVQNTAWSNERIKGQVPGGLQSGPVTITVNGKSFQGKI